MPHSVFTRCTSHAARRMLHTLQQVAPSMGDGVHRIMHVASAIYINNCIVRYLIEEERFKNSINNINFMRKIHYSLLL